MIVEINDVFKDINKKIKKNKDSRKIGKVVMKQVRQTRKNDLQK